MERVMMAGVALTHAPGVYRVVHVASGRCYIGSSVDVLSRRWEHVHLLRKGRHHSPYLQRAWRKYGADAFCWEMVEPVADVAQLVVSAETREKMRQAALRRCRKESPTT